MTKLWNGQGFLFTLSSRQLYLTISQNLSAIEFPPSLSKTIHLTVILVLTPIPLRRALELFEQHFPWRSLGW
jgi:hypothetical protein